MTSTQPPSPQEFAITAKRRTMVSALLMITFLGLFGLATVCAMITGPASPRDEREARTPQRPHNLATFIAAIGSTKRYFAQRYAGKQLFVHLNAEAKIGLFRHTPYQKVLIGKEGWLYLGDNRGPDNELDGLIGRPPTTASSDEAWLALFRKSADALSQKGIGSVLIIAPDKSAIIPEMLPDWVKPVATPRGERIVNALSKPLSPPPMNIFFLLRKLHHNDPNLKLYHETDTHWTELGAAFAIDAALAPLGIHPAQAGPPAYQMTAVEGGDLARIIGRQSYIRTKAPMIERAPRLKCLRPNGEPATLITLDPLPVRHFTCTNADAPNGHALVVMDSFGLAAYPRLTQIFRTVDFIWDDQLNLALVDQLSPDVVIRIIVARKLQDIDPTGLFVTH